MGLIKTAMIGGAGIYAINKFAKVAENRHANPNNQNQNPRDNNTNNYNQQSWGPSGGSRQRDYQYSDDRQPYAPNSQARSVNGGAYSQREYNPADYATDKVEYDEDGWQVQRNGGQGPPPYASQQQQGGQEYLNMPRAYDYDDQSQGQSQGQRQGGRGERLEALANMAMGFIENGGKKNGKKGERSGLSDIFGK